MKTFAVKEKRTAPATVGRRPYVHAPFGSTQRAQRIRIGRILRSTGAQARLTIGQPGDRYEQEADRVADQVMSMSDPRLQRQPENEEEEETLRTKPLADQITPLVQRQEEPPEEEEEAVQAKSWYGETVQRMCSKCEEEQVQRQPEDEELQTKAQPGRTAQVTPNIESRINSLKGGGQLLDFATRSFFEPRFGRDFSDVRLHTDSTAADAARSIHARAFTVGNHIAMGSGEYQPNSQSSQRLLGHELTHVVQQGDGRISSKDQRLGAFESGPIGDQQEFNKRNAYIQCVRWSEGEMAPMLQNEFKVYVINETVTMASQRVPTLGPAFRRILEGPTAIPALVAMLDEMSLQSVGMRYDQQIDFATESARRLITAFVLDPNTSSLDLLSQANRDRFRNFQWGVNDYPGGPTGAHEARARSMANELSALRPQRRANSGADAVVSLHEYTNHIQQHISNNLLPIPAFPNAGGNAPAANQPAGQNLYNTAQIDFIRMRNAALADGVPLVIVSSYRAPAVAQANAAAAGNPAAVAAFSSHSLGLAIDMRMSMNYQNPGGQQQNLQYIETTTIPMQNVVDMRESPVHKWMFLHGAEYGWYPYQNEPWHWEYNPPGFRDAFHQAVVGNQVPGNP